MGGANGEGQADSPLGRELRDSGLEVSNLSRNLESEAQPTEPPRLPALPF